MHEQKVIAEHWSYDDPLSFELSAQDTTTAHELYISVTHRTDYPFQNIYVKMDTEFPSGREDSRLINVDLADKAGNWYGSCSGDVCTYESPLRSRFSFSELGTYDISLAQHTRMENLTGVNKVAVKLFRIE